MNAFVAKFDTLILDLNDTFMFGGDRFSLSENYYSTYQRLGGSQLSCVQVQRAINGVYATLENIYHDGTRYDAFPTVRSTLKSLPESATFADHQNALLVDVFACHELGTIPQEYVDAIQLLAASHDLHLVSNIWAPKARFVDQLKRVGIDECFTTMTFSSDSTSVKPSSRLYDPVLSLVDLQTTLMIGDSQRCDVGAAKAIGCQSVWLSNGRSIDSNAPQPDLIVDNLLALVTKTGSGLEFQRGDRQFRVIHQFAEKHIQQSFELYDREWPDVTRTNSDMRQALCGAEFVIGIIETQTDDLVGFCRVVSDRGFRALLYGVLVRHGYRGLGLGRVLLEQVVGAKEVAGIHSIDLSCAREMNEFYTKFGFELREQETVMRLKLRR